MIRPCPISACISLTDWGQFYHIETVCHYRGQNWQTVRDNKNHNHSENTGSFKRVRVYQHFQKINVPFLRNLFILDCRILKQWWKYIINTWAERDAGPCVPLQKSIESCSKWCVASVQEQSWRSKSNTPIPHHSTTKVFPAATWYAKQRACMKMPRPTAEWSISSFTSGFVINMSVFCFEVQRFQQV